MTREERLRQVGALFIAAAVLVIVLLIARGSEPQGFVTQGFVAARASSKYVQLRVTSDAVTFTNADGEWTIFKRCLGTDVAGVGYVARYVSRKGYVVSNDYQEGGFGELNNPEHGGIGTFGLELARGEGERTWNTTWHLTMRRCGEFGVTRWSVPAFGRTSDGSAYYHQDVWLADGWAELLRVRYRWRFRLRGVDLYGTVTSLCGSEPQACPSPLGAAYVKEPKLVVTLNGQASEQKFSHFSTFDDAGLWIGHAGVHNRECSYGGRNPRQGTGHCFEESRERVRWDYADSAQGGCNVTTRLCFNAVFRSYGSTIGPWESESDSNSRGLEGWAVDAADQPKAGTAGCVTIDGEAVYSPDQENARNWEYAGNKASADAGYDNSMVMAKGWDGCKHSLDATSLYRRLGPGRYGFFLSLSLGSGWRRS